MRIIHNDNNMPSNHYVKPTSVRNHCCIAKGLQVTATNKETNYTIHTVARLVRCYYVDCRILLISLRNNNSIMNYVIEALVYNTVAN